MNASAFLGLPSSVPTSPPCSSLEEIPAPAAAVGRELGVEIHFCSAWREQGLGKNLGKSLVFWVIVQGLFCHCFRAGSSREMGISHK